MHDFRRLPGEVAGHESPGLRFEIKRARYRRQIAIDLHESLAVEPPRFNLVTSILEEPEEVAGEILSSLGIRAEDRAKWKTEYDAFAVWRGAIEGQGVLVFQAKEVDLSEMRGFSISELPLPVITVNIKDAVVGRIFTTLHELCHLMLREGGVCDLTEAPPRNPAEQSVEIFCNAVAGAAIVPEKDVLAEPLVKEHGRSPEWSDSEISSLARCFWSSRETVVRRLLTLGRTNETFYRRKREQYQREYETRETPAGGFAPPYIMALTTAGNLFTRLVLENYYRENITSGDLAEFLDVRLKHLPRIEQMMLGRPVAIGEVG